MPECNRQQDRPRITDGPRGAAAYVETTDEVVERAKDFEATGVRKMDSMHIASAEAASCDWLFTTDKGILKKVRVIGEMRAASPVEFVTWRKDGSTATVAAMVGRVIPNAPSKAE